VRTRKICFVFGLLFGWNRNFEKTKRELKPKREKQKNKKKKKKKEHTMARGFLKNSGCYAFLGGF
jgi:hypothetical protein